MTAEIEQPPTAEEAALQEEWEILRDRCTGKSFGLIDRERDWPLGKASRIWHRAVERDYNMPVLRATAINLEQQRLDALQAGIWPKAMAGDSRAVEVALKVLERRARLLGLDFQDMLNGKIVDIEEGKVRLMAAALTGALQAAGVGPDGHRAAVDAFFAALRPPSADQAESMAVVGVTLPRNEDSLPLAREGMPRAPGAGRKRAGG